jgi:hypothetical protein
MQAAAEYVTYQVPNAHSRVGYLLDAIKSNDAGLQAAMASVRTDQAPNGLRNDFEATATHLLPYDPVQKKRADGKRPSAEISDATGEKGNISSFGTKKGTGTSGVALRYHTSEEYSALSKAQSDELREWRAAEKAAGRTFKGKGGNKKLKFATHEAAIDSAVAKKMNELQKTQKKTKKKEETADAHIMSLFNKFTKAGHEKAALSDVTANLAGLAVTGNSDAPKVTIQSILKRSKNPPKEGE